MLCNKAWINVECCAKHLNAHPIDGLYDQEVMVPLRRGSEEAPQDAEFGSGSLYSNLLGAGNVPVTQEGINLDVFLYAIRVVGAGENALCRFLADQEYFSVAFWEVSSEKIIK
jgi:hypothetical protein